MNVLTYKAHKIYHDIIQGTSPVAVLFDLLHSFSETHVDKSREKCWEFFENLRVTWETSERIRDRVRIFMTFSLFSKELFEKALSSSKAQP